MYKLIPHDELSTEGARELTGYLRDDDRLILALGNRSKDISPDDFIAGNARWAKDKNADIFYITESGIPIGMISLSKQDPLNRTACVGYWIASKYWNKGYATRAFGDIIEIAREKGFVTLSAKIDRNNVYSLRLWENKGARKEDRGDMLLVVLNI